MVWNWRNSQKCNISAYDAAYVQAAKLLNSKLLTGDIKLVGSVGDPAIALENYYSGT
jgi:predicted nucleic acid-binding protein